MGALISKDLTAIGQNMLARIHAGEGTFEATRIVMGSGYIPAGKTAATMTGVVTPVISLSINKAKASNDGMVTYGGVYSNANIAEDFYFRELALYARIKYADGTASTEVLYSYGNFGDTADLYVKYSTDTVVEKQMDIVTWVGNDTEITLTVASGIYITQAEKGAAGGVATLGNDGLLPDAQMPSGALKKSGGTMSGDLNMDGHTVYNLAAPVNDGDAVRKSYADKIGTDTLNNAKAYAYKVASMRSLVLNGDFRHPVNTQGLTSYSGGGETVDGWIADNDIAVEVGDGFLRITNNDTGSYRDVEFELPMGTFTPGETYTGVFVLTDGTACIGTASAKSVDTTLAESSGEVALFQFNARIDTGYNDTVRFRIQGGKSVSVAYCAIYKGSYTAGTLPPFVANGFLQEMAQIEAIKGGPKSFTVVLTNGGWEDNLQTVEAPGVTAENIVLVSPHPATQSYTNYTESGVRCIEQAEDSLTFTCEDTPSAAITVNVTVLNK